MAKCTRNIKTTGLGHNFFKNAIDLWYSTHCYNVAAKLVANVCALILLMCQWDLFPHAHHSKTDQTMFWLLKKLNQTSQQTNKQAKQTYNP